MKNDIRINYSTIANIRDSIGKYKTALETMEQALNNINNVLENENSGEAVNALIVKHEELQSEIDSCKEELETLYNLFSGYYGEMTDIIRPINESIEMRVDRLDIWWNMDSIFDSLTAIEGVAIGGALKPYYNHSSTYHAPATGSAEDEEQAAKEQNNYRKMEEVWDVIKSYRSWFQSDRDYMEKLFNNKIVPYENKDDEYANKAKAVYDKYSSKEERKEIFKQHGKEYIEGLGQNLYDLLTGTVDLAKHGGKYALGFLGWLTSNFTNDVPDALGDYEEDFYKGNQEIKSFLNDPWETTDEIGQQISDTYEEKGPYYAAGYVTPIIASMGRSALPEGEEVIMTCENRMPPLSKVTKLEVEEGKKVVSDRIDNMISNMTEGEKSRTTYGSALVKLEDGTTEMWVSSAGKKGYVPPRIRGTDKVIKNKSLEATSENRFNDAEQTMMREANEINAEVVSIGATRPMCAACQAVAEANGIIGRVATSLKDIKK